MSKVYISVYKNNIWIHIFYSEKCAKRKMENPVKWFWVVRRFLSKKAVGSWAKTQFTTLLHPKTLNFTIFSQYFTSFNIFLCNSSEKMCVAVSYANSSNFHKRIKNIFNDRKRILKYFGCKLFGQFDMHNIRKAAKKVFFSGQSTKAFIPPPSANCSKEPLFSS